MLKKTTKNERRQKRKRRVRKNIFGTMEKPRLSVYRSLNHIHAQIIDDTKGNTIVAASSEELKGKVKSTGNKETAREVGKMLAQKAKDKGIEKIVFDRGGFLYHGRVKELADGARENGLIF